jgi:putative tryptophan/tyrosine transport system substrate-binding protein
MGVLLGSATSDDAKPYVATLEKTLQTLGWTAGQNLAVDYRYAAGDAAQIRSHAQDLSAAKPDVILVSGTGSLQAVQQQTRAIPIVFIQVSDPVGGNFVASLARPGGNITGVMNPDLSIVGDRLKVLKEIAPTVRRVLALFEPDYPTVPGSLRALTAAGESIGVSVTGRVADTVSRASRRKNLEARCPTRR